MEKITIGENETHNDTIINVLRHAQNDTMRYQNKLTNGPILSVSHHANYNTLGWVNSPWTKHNRYIYHTVDFDPAYWSQTKCCMQQLVIEITAGCNEYNFVCNNWLLELQPPVRLQFWNITAGCNFDHQLLQTRFYLFTVTWIKADGGIYVPIMFCPLTVTQHYEVRKTILHHLQNNTMMKWSRWRWSWNNNDTIITVLSIFLNDTIRYFCTNHNIIFSLKSCPKQSHSLDHEQHNHQCCWAMPTAHCPNNNMNH